jgi:hypothetical protein
MSDFTVSVRKPIAVPMRHEQNATQLVEAFGQLAHVAVDHAVVSHRPQHGPIIAVSNTSRWPD